MKIPKSGFIKSRLDAARKKMKRKKQPEFLKVKDPRYLKTIDDIFKDLDKPKYEEVRAAVMGVGNDLRGDDGIGCYVVDRLREILKGDSRILLVKTPVPENHVNEIRDFSPAILIIVDAANFGERPGKIRVIREYQIKKTFVSTHTTPLTLFLRLYGEDSPTSKPVVLMGIQAENNEFGAHMSDSVKKTGDILARAIAKLHSEKRLHVGIEKEVNLISRTSLDRFRDNFRKKK